MYYFSAISVLFNRRLLLEKKILCFPFLYRNVHGLFQFQSSSIDVFYRKKNSMFSSFLSKCPRIISISILFNRRLLSEKKFYVFQFPIEMSTDYFNLSRLQQRSFIRKKNSMFSSSLSKCPRIISISILFNRRLLSKKKNSIFSSSLSICPRIISTSVVFNRRLLSENKILCYPFFYRNVHG